jgi:hypothetical protein
MLATTVQAQLFCVSVLDLQLFLGRFPDHIKTSVTAIQVPDLTRWEVTEHHYTAFRELLSPRDIVVEPKNDRLSERGEVRRFEWRADWIKF